MAPYYVVIPARYASTRLPAKPLADIGGVPMIVRVAAQARRSGAETVVVATDHAEVRDVVLAAGYDAEMTDPDHQSGSDRVMEVAQRRGWGDADIVINVQGDEPLLPPAIIDQLADAMVKRPDIAVATLCEPLDAAAALFNPNVVKLVRRQDGRALYFSRAPIPWARDAFGSGTTEAVLTAAEVQLKKGPLLWQRHIGIYGYRVAALRAFCKAPAGQLEQIEALEQLRMMEIGLDILVEPSAEPVPGGVDTPEDLERIRRWVAEHESS
jgi:3-deoxy-manno-octulosonate cytidylyltransferase (CMP-KDO synthetase)